MTTSTDPFETEPRDRGALWHFREASRYASLASYTNQDPNRVQLEAVRLVNPAVQAHFREMAQVHATIFAGLASVLGTGPHGAARSQLASLASLPDEG